MVKCQRTNVNVRNIKDDIINKKFIMWISKTLDAEEEGVSDPKDTGESVKTETQRHK